MMLYKAYFAPVQGARRVRRSRYVDGRDTATRSLSRLTSGAT
jgi:hypothetical protein